jgi:hypothetical protein
VRPCARGAAVRSAARRSVPPCGGAGTARRLRRVFRCRHLPVIRRLRPRGPRTATAASRARRRPTARAGGGRMARRGHLRRAGASGASRRRWHGTWRCPPRRAVPAEACAEAVRRDRVAADGRERHRCHRGRGAPCGRSRISHERSTRWPGVRRTRTGGRTGRAGVPDDRASAPVAVVGRLVRGDPSLRLVGTAVLSLRRRRGGRRARRAPGAAGSARPRSSPRRRCSPGGSCHRAPR